jgi:hypothetical protein
MSAERTERSRSEVDVSQPGVIEDLIGLNRLS